MSSYLISQVVTCMQSVPIRALADGLGAKLKDGDKREIIIFTLTAGFGKGGLGDTDNQGTSDG